MSVLPVISRVAVIALMGAVPLAEVASAADWPQWRGPERTGVTTESSGYPKGWPPKKLWSANVGKGCTSPVIADGRLFVMGWQGRDGKGADTVRCFSAADGKELWKQSYAAPYQGRFRTGDEGAYGGPNGTPTFEAASERLYTLGVDGDLKCWNAADGGRGVWSVNLYDTLKIKQRPDSGGGQRDYGCTSGPLIVGDAVIVAAGAPAGTLVAFDKATGKLRWASECTDPAGHTGGPVAATLDGVPCVVDLSLFALLVARTDRGREGKTLVRVPWQTDYANNIPTPAVADGGLVVTSDYNVSRTAMIKIAGGKAGQAWSVKDHSTVCSPVVHKGRVFGVQGTIHCLDLTTGKRLWRGGQFEHGSVLVTGDDKVIVFGRGRLTLLDATADEYRPLSELEGIVRGTCYPHVALADGLIACKDRDGNLVVLSILTEKPRPQVSLSVGVRERYEPGMRRRR